MTWNNDTIAQIQLPDPKETDPHPRLLINGRGIHAGDCFTALFPDGWHDIRLEVGGIEGPWCWYIDDSKFRYVCPVGLFVKI